MCSWFSTLLTRSCLPALCSLAQGSSASQFCIVRMLVQALSPVYLPMIDVTAKNLSVRVTVTSDLCLAGAGLVMLESWLQGS